MNDDHEILLLAHQALRAQAVELLHVLSVQRQELHALCLQAHEELQKKRCLEEELIATIDHVLGFGMTSVLLGS